jgi:hypothetical protein
MISGGRYATGSPLSQLGETSPKCGRSKSERREQNQEQRQTQKHKLTLEYGVGGDSTGKALELGDRGTVEIGVCKEAISGVDSRRTKAGPGGARSSDSHVLHTFLTAKSPRRVSRGSTGKISPCSLGEPCIPTLAFQHHGEGDLGQGYPPPA